MDEASTSTLCESCEGYQETVTKLRERIIQIREHQQQNDRRHEEQITALEGRLREERSRCDQLEQELQNARAAMVAPEQEQEESNNDKGKGPAVVETLNVIATGMYKLNLNCRIKFQKNFNQAK